MLIVLSIILLITILTVAIYNRFIQLKAFLDEASSGIDVQLKRRHDLIPNIVEVVKGYSRYERGTLENVIKLRSQVSSLSFGSERNKMENEISAGLKSLFAIAENYPDLKANQNFLSLQNSLSEIEDQIQLARRYYNGTARNNNILVQSFPSNMIANVFHFSMAKFFEIEYATERQVPDVKLG